MTGILVAPILRLTVRDPIRGGLDRQPPAAAGEAAGEPAAPVKAPRFKETVAFLARKPSFWLLAFGAAACSVCGYGISAWLPSFFIRSFGLSLSHTAFYYSAIILVGGVAGLWFGGQLVDRLGQLSKRAYGRVPAIAFLISVPCFVLAMNSQALISMVLPGVATDSWPALAVAYLIFLIPTGLNVVWMGPVSAAIQHLAPATMRASATAMLMLISNLIGIGIGVFYFGFMSDLLRPAFGEESLRWSIYTGMGFYLIAALLFFLASKTLEKDWVD